jgi:hypothetical protein
MGPRKRAVWVVMHYEIMGMPDAHWVDSLQSHLSSSLKNAEKYIRSTGVDSHSRWQVHPHVIDSDDFPEGEEVYFYSHRGTRLKSAPMNRAIAAFAKHVARNHEFYPPSGRQSQDELS